MSIDFRPADFFYPLLLLRTMGQLNRSQWLDAAGLRALQGQRLAEMAAHCQAEVPYYTERFSEVGLRPEALRDPEALSQLPVLSKADLRKEFARLQPGQPQRWDPRTYSSSGSSGTPLLLPFSREMRVLELAAYQRQWSWVGYRPWHCMAQVDGEFWIRRPELADRLMVYRRGANSLYINPFRVSVATAPKIANALRRHKVRYLRGLASVCHALALSFGRAGVSSYLRAVFTSSETVTPALREKVRLTFSAQVMDSYGLMESVAKIVQCNAGSYHVLSDYARVELHPEPQSDPREPRTARVIGSTLHNKSLPLLRYDTGDRVELLDDSVLPCTCGHAYPVVKGILGRSDDVVLTPDARRIGHSFLLPRLVTGVEHLQVHQAADFAITLWVVPSAQWTSDAQIQLLQHARRMYGQSVPLTLQVVKHDELHRHSTGKLPLIVSDLPRALLRG